jgi:prephenate dehydratase
MDNYPPPALALVDGLVEAAAAAPASAVAFQGAPGAYSHQAVREVFPDGLPVPCFSFEDALDAVAAGRVGRAVIPIENSLHGRVADMHFLLPESGLHIVGEHFVRVRHCLLVLPGAGEPAEVLSHPQALGQCRHYLRGRGIKPVAYPDTAAAAAAVADMGDPRVGAIASALAGELYGLVPRAEGIEDESHNTTRFVVLASEPVALPRDQPGLMTTFTFEVKNIPAALYKALGGFATNGVNMTKLESYQRGASFAATEFYADIDGHPDDPPVRRALEELEFHTKWVRLLGTYPQARRRGLPAAD